MTPFGLHLSLLERAAAGEPIPRQVVARLAAVWDRALGTDARARLHARALELGVIDAAAAATGAIESVGRDLRRLAAVAHGRWPATIDSGLAAQLRRETDEDLYRDLEPYLAPYRHNGPTIEIGYPLDEWERWLAFRSLLDRLVEANGREVIATAWYQGVRGAAWNWPCKLLEIHQARAAWACVVMFQWAADLGEAAQDEEAVRVNRSNVDVAMGMVPA
jgi:hypothetical protein